MSLWSDIKQRRITQIFLSYLLGGWIILQVVDQVVDRDVVPRYVYLVALIFFLFGIPAALVIGWYHGEKGSQKATPLEVALLSLLGVGAVGSSVIVVQDALRLQAAQSGQIELTRMAVLYFSAEDEESSPVGVGLTEDLIGRLSRVPELDVVSRNGARTVRDEGMTFEEAAEFLDVGTVLSGDVRRSGDEFVVNVQLRTRDDIRLASVSARGSANELLTLQDELAAQVEEEIRTAMGAEIRLRESRSAAPNNGAWLAVARGERAIQAATAAAGRQDAQAAMQALSEADASFEEAIRVGDQWAHPWALRAQVAYEESYLAHSMEDLNASLLETMAMAEEALGRDPTNALALYLRGTARYRRFLFGLAHDEDAEALLRSVEEDLESAQTLDRTMAEVPSTLSHLYYQRGDVSSAAVAAQQAYERDAFLQSADGVLRRLFDTNYDLENADRARDWCLEGNRRFPDDYAFVECQLMLMTMNGTEPDVTRAWALRDSVVALAPADQEYLAAFATQNVAGIIARAGLADSASAVMTGARVGTDVDPEMELLTVEAAMRLLNGENDEALALLQRYSAVNPGHFSAGRSLNWRWRPLQGNPDFERLRRLN